MATKTITSRRLSIGSRLADGIRAVTAVALILVLICVGAAGMVGLTVFVGVLFLAGLAAAVLVAFFGAIEALIAKIDAALAKAEEP